MQTIRDLTRLVARLRDVGTDQLPHLYASGLCPDRLEGPDTRDPECPACTVLTEADTALAGSGWEMSLRERMDADSAETAAFPTEAEIVRQVRDVMESSYHTSEQQAIYLRGLWHAPERTPGIAVGNLAGWLHGQGFHDAGRHLEQESGQSVPCIPAVGNDPARNVFVSLLVKGVGEREAVLRSGYQRCPLDAP